MDGVVLLCGCDKTTPAQLMGAASADLPAIIVTGGPMLKGMWRNKEIGSGTDVWHYWDELRAGRISEEDWCEIECSMSRSAGHCMVMGTASTMTSLAEAMGMTLPGCANIPAADSRRYEIAQRSGERIVEMVKENLKPSQIITRDSLENAIRIDMAIGGSTNAIIHLKAIAGRLGIDLTLERFDQISRETAVVANIRPSGEYLMEDMFYAGGIPVVMNDIMDQLQGEAMTVTGKTIADNVAGSECHNREVLLPRQNALQKEGGTIVLSGNLCPRGAVLKTSAATPELLQHIGRAVVFEDHGDLMNRIDEPDLEATPESVLVLKNGGPIGGPGMPEYGNLPIPTKLLKQGIKDMVRISDSRMSGTSYGTVVLHITPESAAGGPLALVENGDEIQLDTANRRLDLLIPEEEFEKRRQQWEPRQDYYDRGYGKLYLDTVLQADEGCNFSFLRKTNRAARKIPLAF